MRSTNWCLTLNNPTQEELDDILNWDVAYRVGQCEKGVNGTIHIQAYVIFNGRME